MKKRSNSISDYEKFCRLGYGQGSGPSYRPWFNPRDISSRSVRSSFFWKKQKRRVVLLSHGEAMVFYFYDWLENVVDIREQFPLDPALTQQIAEEFGFPHPGIRGEKSVMTSDFVITFTDGRCRFYDRVLQIKADRRDLQNQRTCQKLCIEEEYWKRKGVSWHLVLSSELPRIFLRNLETLFVFRNSGLPPALKECAPALLKKLQKEYPTRIRLSEIASAPIAAGSEKYDLGRAARLLLAHKVWRAPLKTVLLEELRICDLTLENPHVC